MAVVHLNYINETSKFHYTTVLHLQVSLSQPQCLASYSCQEIRYGGLSYFEYKTYTVRLPDVGYCHIIPFMFMDGHIFVE